MQTYRQSEVEIIVVDGGSSDATVELARPLCDVIEVAKKGRARQMNAGANKARGRILLFLHADTLLPDNAISLIEESLRENTRVWGRFDVCLSGHRKGLRVIEYCMNSRSRWTGIATGDQAIFVCAKTFFQLGGYPDIALMEDISLSKALKKISFPVCLKEHVITSSRRWESFGICRTIFLMWKLRLAYYLGVSPEKLATYYEKK